MRGKNGETMQLLEIASIFVLENMLRERGIDPEPLWYSADGWVDFGEPMEAWIQDSAKALAQAIVAAASIVDFSAAVIDGGFPDWVRSRLVQATIDEAAELDLQASSCRKSSRARSARRRAPSAAPACRSPTASSEEAFGQRQAGAAEGAGMDADGAFAHHRQPEAFDVDRTDRLLDRIHEPRAAPTAASSRR